MNCSNSSFVSSCTPADAAGTNLCWFLAVISWMSFKLVGFWGLSSFIPRPNPRPTSNTGGNVPAGNREVRYHPRL